MKVLLFVGFLVVVLVMLSMNVVEGYTLDDNITWLKGIENDSTKEKKLHQIQDMMPNKSSRIQDIIDNNEHNPLSTKITRDTSLRIAIQKLEYKRNN